MLAALLDMLRGVVVDFADVLFGPGDGQNYCFFVLVVCIVTIV
jgi:hypothetical protein